MIIQHGLAKAGAYPAYSQNSSASVKKQDSVQQSPAKSSEHKLSAKAANFLANLRSERDNFDFIVADAGDDHKALVQQSDKEFTVVYTSAELERMASDPKFAAEKKQQIETTLSMSKKICEQNGYVSVFGQDNRGNKAKTDAFWAEHDMLYAQQTAAAINKVNDGRQTALEIYRRMARGAAVSPNDERTLMGYDPNMYQAAKMSQQMAEKHEDMSGKSLTDEFYKRHENDRRDWSSELDERVEELQKNDATESSAGGTIDTKA